MNAIENTYWLGCGVQLTCSLLFHLYCKKKCAFFFTLSWFRQQSPAISGLPWVSQTCKVCLLLFLAIYLCRESSAPAVVQKLVLCLNWQPLTCKKVPKSQFQSCFSQSQDWNWDLAPALNLEIACLNDTANLWITEMSNSGGTRGKRVEYKNNYTI